MKRNVEKTGIYDEDNAKALIGRIYKKMTGRSSKELDIIRENRWAIKVILNDKNIYITKAPLDEYYKFHSIKERRNAAINKIKEKLQLLLNP